MGYGRWDLGTADWGCLASHCASLCLQAAHGGRAAGGLVSDESALEACSQRCAIQIDNFLPFTCWLYAVLTLPWFRVTPCLENTEISGNFTAVTEMLEIWVKIREMSGKISCQGKLLENFLKKSASTGFFHLPITLFQLFYAVYCRVFLACALVSSIYIYLCYTLCLKKNISDIFNSNLNKNCQIITVWDFNTKFYSFIYWNLLHLTAK